MLQELSKPVLDRDVEHGFTTVAIPSDFDAINLRRVSSKRQRRGHVILALIAGDFMAIVIAIVTATLLRLGSIDTNHFLATAATLVPLYFLFALNNGSHDIAILKDFYRSIRRPVMALVYSFCSLLLIAFLLKAGSEFSRLIFIIGTFLSIGTLIVSRTLIRKWSMSYLGRHAYAHLCIYDGVPRGLNSGEGAIDASAVGLNPDTTDPRAVNRLGRFAQGMDRVIVHCHPDRREDWAFMLKSLDVPTEIVINEFASLAPLGLQYRGGLPSLQLGGGPLAWNQKLLKHSFDLLFCLAVIPVLVPFLAIVALAVKLDSPGPVLFKQQRIGLGNRPFMILKFRSMRVEKCDARGDRSASRDDDRITRVGRFIRSTSIDELPQLFNVLLGDMSVVGPRPHAEGSRAENALFWDIDTRYWHRHSVKPGLTGLAQIRGYRGATEVKSDLSKRLQSDLEYVANWSLTGDVRIILQTFSVLLHKNAF